MQWFTDFLANAKTKIAQFNNAKFRDAVLATSALIAAADGSIDPAERKKVAKLIQNNEMLSVFDVNELAAKFDDFCNSATDDFKRITLINCVRAVKGNDEYADTALRVAIIIANSDGNFDEKEKVVVRELCGVLGLSAASYGV